MSTWFNLFVFYIKVTEQKLEKLGLEFSSTPITLPFVKFLVTRSVYLRQNTNFIGNAQSDMLNMELGLLSMLISFHSKCKIC